MRGFRSGVLLAFIAAGVATTGARAQTAVAESPARLRAGTVEVTVAGSMVTIEGITSGAVTAGGTYFMTVFGGLAGLEVNGAYRHVSSLDAVDIEGMVSWQRRLRRSSTYPFMSVGGGVRGEDIGSFSEVRYPIGFGLGVRALFGQRAAVRAEYRFRRLLDDPVENFSEHQVMIGLSILFRNPAEPITPE